MFSAFSPQLENFNLLYASFQWVLILSPTHRGTQQSLETFFGNQLGGHSTIGIQWVEPKGADKHVIMCRTVQHKNV